MILLPINQIFSQGINSSVQKSNVTKRFINRNNNTDIFIVAHRANGFNAPENSIAAIDSCLSLGLDIIELDVKKTKDDVLIIFHDDTLGRTVDQIIKDSIQFIKWDRIKNLDLKKGNIYYRGQNIPTLKEILLFIDGRCMVNLDYAIPHVEEVIKLAYETNMINNIIIKGSYKPEDINSKLGNFKDSIIYMPILIDRKNVDQNFYDIPEYIDQFNPFAFELVFDTMPTVLLNTRVLSKLQSNGAKLWVNMLVPELNGGKNEKYIEDQFLQNYQFLLENNFRIIQTDFTKELKKFRDTTTFFNNVSPL